MRCRCCDKRLSDFESTRKNINTNEYIDMCNKCYGTINRDVLTYERNDLKDDSDNEETYNDDDLFDGLDIMVDNHDKNW